MDFMVIFGNNLRRLREQKGLSQIELARMVGYKTKDSISKIELAQNNVTTTMTMRLANALGVDVSTLLEGCLNPYYNYEEYLPYLAKAEDWKIKAIRDLLGMPEMK